MYDTIRRVTATYRTARQAGASHERAMDAAIAVYLQARPDAHHDSSVATPEVAVMVAGDRGDGGRSSAAHPIY
jgi:hypothetical protein